MVGGADLLNLAKWLDPVTTVLVGAAILIYIRRVVQPRLSDVEDTQEDRRDRLQDHELDAQEQAILIDDNAERVDQVSQVQKRLKKRVRRLEQSFAAEHNRPPRGTQSDGGDRGDGSTPSASTDRPPDDGGFEEDDPGADGDDDGPDHPGAEAATRRCRERLQRIRDGVCTALPSPVDQQEQRRHRRPHAGGDD